MRVLTILAAAMLLAACSLGATAPSDEASDAASASQMTSTACADAFGAIDVEAVVSMGSLDALADELDATISACDTADDWEAAAEIALPGLDISDPQEFLAARCAENATLGSSLICAELGS